MGSAPHLQRLQPRRVARQPQALHAQRLAVVGGARLQRRGEPRELGLMLGAGGRCKGAKLLAPLLPVSQMTSACKASGGYPEAGCSGSATGAGGSTVRARRTACEAMWHCKWLVCTSATTCAHARIVLTLSSSSCPSRAATAASRSPTARSRCSSAAPCCALPRSSAASARASRSPVALAACRTWGGRRVAALVSGAAHTRVRHSLRANTWGLWIQERRVNYTRKLLPAPRAQPAPPLAAAAPRAPRAPPPAPPPAP